MNAQTLKDQYPALCTNCTHDASITMLSGYCITSARCDGCGKVGDLAMCVKRNVWVKP